MKATDTIDNLEELEHIPEDKKDRYEEGLRVKRSVSCTVIEYFKAIKNKIIDPNPKCNRIDRDDLKKKQGILNVLFIWLSTALFCSIKRWLSMSPSSRLSFFSDNL